MDAQSQNIPPLRIGLIGCGRIGYLLEDDPLRGHPCTHAGAIAQVPTVRFAAACDIDPERLADFGRRYDVTQLYASWEEMLRRESLDLLVVASWSSTHAPIVMGACDAGVRGILCEKPIALDLAAGRQMIARCKQAGVKLVINHERRFDARYQQARAMIAAGAIGDVRTVVANVLTRRWPAESVAGNIELSGGGPLLHDGTHLFDALRFLVGELAWVAADVEWPEGGGVETTARVQMRFASGAGGFLEGGGDRRYFNFEIDVQGSSGRLRIGNGILGLEHTTPSSRYTGFEDLTPAEFPPAPTASKSAWVAAVEELVECVHTGRESTSSGEDGLAALEAIKGVYRSGRHGGTRVTLPLVEDDEDGAPPAQ
jgi:predicted dehydrogenase